MMYNAASSASVADVMTCLIMCAMFKMAPLLDGTSAPLERKKWPPALLLALGSLSWHHCGLIVACRCHDM